MLCSSCNSWFYLMRKRSDQSQLNTNFFESNDSEIDHVHDNFVKSDRSWYISKEIEKRRQKETTYHINSQYDTLFMSLVWTLITSSKTPVTNIIIMKDRVFVPFLLFELTTRNFPVQILAITSNFMDFVLTKRPQSQFWAWFGGLLYYKGFVV